MTQPAGEIIDQIVREVMARLGGVRSDPIHRGSAPPTGPAPHERGHDEHQQGPPERASRDGELVVNCRVVSLAALEDRLDHGHQGGVRRLVVPPDAVLTPSVRDELRRRNIAVVYGRPATPSTQVATGVLIMVLGSHFDPAPLESELACQGMAVRVERADCLVAATDAVALFVAKPGGPQTVAVLVSTYPAAAVCLANRHAGVRAVLGMDSTRLAADAASVGANVLVLDPRTTPSFQLKQMTVQFCRHGPLACPAELRQRLG